MSQIDASTMLPGDGVFLFHEITPFSSLLQVEIYSKQVDVPGPAFDKTVVFFDTDGDGKPEMIINSVARII